MAITNLVGQPDYISAQESIWIVAESDIATYSNFKFVIEVIEMINNTKIATLKVYPDVNNGKCYSDIGSIVRNYLSYDWFKNISMNHIIAYQLSEHEYEGRMPLEIQVGEEYYNGVDLVQNLNQSILHFSVYNYQPTLFNSTISSASTPILSSFQNKFLTNRPFIPVQNGQRIFTTIGGTEPILVGMFLPTTQILIDIETYNSNGVMTDANQYFYSVTSSGQYDFYQFNISPYAINSDLFNGIIIPSRDAYYKITIGNERPIYVFIKCKSDYNPIFLHFMNCFGVFDTAIFDCTNKLTMNVARKSFERKEAIFNNADMRVMYGINNVYNERKINIDGIINHTYKLQMSFPTDEEYDWLSELIYSPQVYMTQNGKQYPVTIKNSDYEYFKYKYAKLKTFEIDVELNQNKNTFRR